MACMSVIQFLPAPPRTAPDPSGLVVRSGDLRATTIENGAIWQRAPAREGRPYRLGLVTDSDGDIVRDSLTIRSKRRTPPVGTRPDLSAIKSAPMDERAVLFCGQAHTHFGHFVMETISRLWWGLENNFDGPFIFTQSMRFKERKFVFDFLKHIGIADRTELVFEPRRYRTITIPEAGFVARQSIHLKSLETIGAIKSKVEKGALEKIYLTRSRISTGRLVGEQYVEDVFRQNGFTIVSPEMLSVTEQIRLASGAKVIAGSRGSAMHWTLFSDHAEMICIDRDGAMYHNYFLLDLMRAQPTTYISTFEPSPKRAIRDFKTATLLNVDLTRECLTLAGLSVDGVAVPNQCELKKEYDALILAGAADAIERRRRRRGIDWEPPEQ